MEGTKYIVAMDSVSELLATTWAQSLKPIFVYILPNQLYLNSMQNLLQLAIPVPNLPMDIQTYKSINNKSVNNKNNKFQKIFVSFLDVSIQLENDSTEWEFECLGWLGKSLSIPVHYSCLASQSANLCSRI